MVDKKTNGETWVRLERGDVTAGKYITDATSRALVKAIKNANFKEGVPHNISLPVKTGSGDADFAIIPLTKDVDFREERIGEKHSAIYMTPEAIGRVTEEVNKMQKHNKGGLSQAVHKSAKARQAVDIRKWGSTGVAVNRSPGDSGRER